MKSVKGVSKHAFIMVAGVIAGLFIWFQVVSLPAGVEAAAAFTGPLFIKEVTSQDELTTEVSLKSSLSLQEELDNTEENTSQVSEQTVLTKHQEFQLETVSKNYIAPTTEDSTRVARSLNFVKDNGDPTNVCGPLSIAILRDAGLIEPYVKLRDYWLLNPDDNRKLLELTFPTERFLHFHFTSALDEMDWNSFPLQPGDFLYLYAGQNGTFEHMLVITRVDDSGRAYSVTNHATPDGFVIDEVLLYDPGQAGVGKFYEWSLRKNNKLGSTGLGGFELWRLNQPILEKSPEQISFAREFDSVMESRGGDWYVTVKNLNGKLLYDRQANVPVDIGSMMKLPVAMLFFKSLELQGITPDEYEEYLSEEGPGRSYEQLLHAMFVNSEGAAIRSLLENIRYSGMDVDAQITSWGLKNTHLDSGKSSILDMVALYEGLYSGGMIDPSCREYLLALMDESTTEKDSRLGVLRKTNPMSLESYLRRGSTQDTVVAIGDSAIISVPVVDGEDSYIVIMLGFYDDDMPTTDQDLVAAVEEMAQVFWSFSRK